MVNFETTRVSIKPCIHCKTKLFMTLGVTTPLYLFPMQNTKWHIFAQLCLYPTLQTTHSIFTSLGNNGAWRTRRTISYRIVEGCSAMDKVVTTISLSSDCQGKSLHWPQILGYKVLVMDNRFTPVTTKKSLFVTLHWLLLACCSRIFLLSHISPDSRVSFHTFSLEKISFLIL